MITNVTRPNPMEETRHLGGQVTETLHPIQNVRKGKRVNYSGGAILKFQHQWRIYSFKRRDEFLLKRCLIKDLN